MGAHSRLRVEAHRRRRRRSPAEDEISVPAVHPRRPSVLDYRPPGRSSLRRPLKEEKLSSEEEEEVHPEKELFPLGHYINDPPAMIEEIFSVIKGSKLDAMLTSTLREMDMEDLKENCLIQLEGMSKKRIRCILMGEEMEESSNTEEEDDDRSSIPEDVYESNGENGHESIPLDDDDMEEGGGMIEKKAEAKSKDLVEPEVDKRSSVGITKKDKKIDVPVADVVCKTEGETSKMELLELEMRARAIKALLGKDEKSEIKINLSVEEASQEDEEGRVTRQEESVRRRKARQALEVSEAKKREEAEKRERKQMEMLRRIEEHALEMREKEVADAKMAKEEAERREAKVQREEEHQKFLRWKEEKLRKEGEQKAATQRQMESEAKRTLKRSLDSLRKKSDGNKKEKKNAHQIKKTKKNRVEAAKKAAPEALHSPVSSEEDEALRRTFEDGELESEDVVPSRKRSSERKLVSSSDESKKKDEVDPEEEKRLREEDLERERRQKLHQDRMMRMQAFQERTCIPDDDVEMEDLEEEEETSKDPPLSDEKKDNVFYKSFIEEINKPPEEEKSLPDSTTENLAAVHPPPPPAKKMLPKKIDGIAEVAKRCEAEGDFVPENKNKSKDSNKEEEVEETQTWAERWFQDKNVQKVVKESKALSKVRANIKMKSSQLKSAGPPKDSNPEKLEEVVSTLPDVSTLGSMTQYAKIVGKSLEELEKSRVDPEDPKVSDYDDDEISLGDEDLWGDIMGTNNE